MKDNIRIKQTDPTHYEIRRTMVEVVNRANLDDRLDNLNHQIEALEDQLDTLKRNRQALLDAQETGLGQTEKLFEDKVPVGD